MPQRHRLRQVQVVRLNEIVSSLRLCPARFAFTFSEAALVALVLLRWLT